MSFTLFKNVRSSPEQLQLVKNIATIVNYYNLIIVNSTNRAFCQTALDQSSIIKNTKNFIKFVRVFFLYFVWSTFSFFSCISMEIYVLIVKFYSIKH